MRVFQQLLRGWLVYMLLALLIGILYLRGTSISPELLGESHQQAAVSDEAWRRSIGLPELYHAVLHNARLRIVLSAIVLLGVGMGLAGLGLSLWGFLKVRAPSLRTISDRASGMKRLRPKPITGWSMGEVVRVAVLVVMAALLLPFVRAALIAVRPALGLDHLLWMTVAMLALDGFAVLAMLTFALQKGPAPWRVFGITPRTIRPAVRIGLLRYLMLFPWLFVTLYLIAQVARAFGYEPPVEPIHRLIFQERRPQALQLTVLLACVVGPIAEELFFRGVLYGALRQRASRVIAIAVTAAIFALIHTNLIGFLPIFLLGYLLADVYDRTGSLASSIAVHVVHNTFLMSIALATRYAMSVA